MSQMPSLQELASVDRVENIYLFVADSVRESVTSEAITSLGVSGRAIAASTYTASSFPSILSGQYPATHCVWSFDDRLPNQPALLCGPEAFGMNADTIWTDLPPEKKPPFKMIGATGEHKADISVLDPQFVAVEHHKGGHLPYGHSFSEYASTDNFFKTEKPALSELFPLYQRSVQTAEQRFLDAIEYLRNCNLLEETLVIYTSDHGEALGEVENSGTIGHGDPISPDLVDVPVVFAGAGLPNSNLDRLLSGVDIAPTALSALGQEIDSIVDGQDCWTNEPSDRLFRSERWIQYESSMFGELDRYKASSVWDVNGGIVFHQGSLLMRLVLATGNEFVKAPWAYLNRNPRQPKRWVKMIRSYAANTLRYGDPEFSDKEAAAEIERFEKSSTPTEESIDRDQLRKLGYLE
jgi:arylsulfatase A-like enzyme